MNIENAAKEWKVTVKTVLDYIGKRYIIGISIVDDEIIIPSIPKPYVKKKPKTIKDIDNYICEALNHEGYANYRILDIEKEKFEERLRALTDSNMIKQRNPANQDYKTTLNYMLVASAEKTVVIAPTIAPTIEMKIADQIGLVNTNIATL